MVSLGYCVHDFPAASLVPTVYHMPMLTAYNDPVVGNSDLKPKLAAEGRAVLQFIVSQPSGTLSLATLELYLTNMGSTKSLFDVYGISNAGFGAGVPASELLTKLGGFEVAAYTPAGTVSH